MERDKLLEHACVYVGKSLILVLESHQYGFLRWDGTVMSFSNGSLIFQ